jgi:ferritin-like metal-binding protein YciE
MAQEDRKDLFVSWLKDAYSMEQSIAQVLENHVKDAKDHPQLQARLQQHLEQTRHHAELDKACLERLGESPSTLKSTMANVMGTFQGMSTGMAKDELVKNAIADYSTEYFEIASYQALIAAAQDLGQPECVLTFQQILREEEAMVSWLQEQLPMLVQETLQQRGSSTS